VDIQRTRLLNNYAVNSAGEMLGAGFADAIYSWKPAKIHIKNSQLEPFTEGKSAAISPGLVAGIIVGGCRENPCQPGYSCDYTNYSLSCHPCKEKLFSDDGVACTGK
jgi:hypothetical protein